MKSARAAHVVRDRPTRWYAAGMSHRVEVSFDLRLTDCARTIWSQSDQSKFLERFIYPTVPAGRWQFGEPIGERARYYTDVSDEEARVLTKSTAAWPAGVRIRVS